jgi:site-specific DNA recombinase
VKQVAPPVNVDNHPNIGHLYQRRIEQIVKLFSDEDTQQEAVNIIRSLIDRIDITPGESRGKPKVELIGDLAAILQLTISGHKKTAIRKDSGICRVLMVAGAGFEPATFRL